MIKEQIEKQVNQARKRSTFWSRKFHSDEVHYSDEGMLTANEMKMQDEAYGEVMEQEAP